MSPILNYTYHTILRFLEASVVFPDLTRSTQSGFTLIELMAVMIIAGILASTVSIRFSPSDINLQAAKSDVLAALVFTRETAMARSDGSSLVRFISAENTIDVQVNNVSIASGHQAYPITLKDSVSITSGVGVLDFNRLGETEVHSLVLSEGVLISTITISGVGYAY
jgi:prepilin-type N-terminal cleavage/methylation domain-containing protein